jgi:hypothetical protein
MMRDIDYDLVEETKVRRPINLDPFYPDYLFDEDMKEDEESCN